MSFNQTGPSSSANFGTYNDISGDQNTVNNNTYNSKGFHVYV